MISIIIFFLFKDDRVAFPSPGTLQLYGLCINDAGLYQCTVINQGGAAIYKCNLYVEEGSYTSISMRFIFHLFFPLKNP